MTCKHSFEIVSIVKEILWNFISILNLRKKTVQNQSRIPKCFYESILSGFEWNFSVTARNVVFDSLLIKSFEVSMACIWIGFENEAFYCTEMSSFHLILINGRKLLLLSQRGRKWAMFWSKLSTDGTIWPKHRPLFVDYLSRLESRIWKMSCLTKRSSRMRDL